eukprot:CAMPEP_0113498778 /NCGR_PEP_ID=MMETSP0014_2-20120614/31371_1 /TAXON_ID=2857 /ORGANISM="Nitzschia sp." /LENGTH=264 /DNA_ID=CAMNT_0000392859 /DNA_START=1 /DNA_END=798 /DNA_ORIENTATION=+ /assembly_acc=CAM_ASM_000159
MFSPKKRGGKHKKSDSGQYYFVPREARPVVAADASTISRDQDGGDSGQAVLEAKPNVDEDAFTPKAVNRKVFEPLDRGNSVASADSLSKIGLSRRRSSIIKSQHGDRNSSSGRSGSGSGGQANPLSRTLMRVFGGKKEITRTEAEGAKKIDPKVFFAAERTFLEWMKASISVAAISIAIGAFDTGDENTGLAAWAGIFFSAIAIGFTIYALLQYAKRSLMIVRRSPGPWEDRRGPVVLGSLFFLSLLAQFCIYMSSYVIQARSS